MSNHVFASYNGMYVSYGNNGMYVSYVNNGMYVPYVNNNMHVPYVNNGMFSNDRSIFNCRLDSSEKNLTWCDDRFIAYCSENGEFSYTSKELKVKLFEMINKKFFILVYAEQPTQFVLSINGNDCKTIETSEPIIGLRFHSYMLAVIQINHIFVFQCNENDISVLDKITYYTDPNPFGLCEFKNNVIVFPGTKENRVLRIINTQDNTEKKLKLQHSREIFFFALDQTGDFLAISFYDIPIIYIWSRIKDKQIFILETCTTTKLFYINFSADSKLVCCSTINGEINIFNTDISELEDVDDIDFRERKMKVFINFIIPLRQPGICKFLSNNIIQVICKSDGMYYPFTYSMRMINSTGYQSFVL